MIIVWPQCLLQCMCVCGMNEHACIHVCVCACPFDSFGGDIAPETPTRVVGTCLTPEKPPKQVKLSASSTKRPRTKFTFVGVLLNGAQA